MRRKGEGEKREWVRWRIIIFEKMERN